MLLFVFFLKIMIPGLFNSAHISSNKLLSNIDEAKNDAADFMLSQLYPQSFIDLNDFYKLGQPPTAAQLINHQTTTPNSTPPPPALSSSSSSSIQQTANTNNTLNVNSTNNNLNAQLTPNETNNNLQHFTTPVNQANTPPFITVPGHAPAAVVPQFIFDPTGNYSYLDIIKHI
jgi:hypothetical protein